MNKINVIDILTEQIIKYFTLKEHHNLAIIFFLCFFFISLVDSVLVDSNNQ